LSARLRVAIVGGGIAGAALAALLSRCGHHVEGFERCLGLIGGAELLLAPPALALLQAMDLGESAHSRGALVCGLRATHAHGGALLQWDVRRWGYPCMGLGIQRRVLHEILLGAAVSSVRWQQGIDIRHVEPLRGWITDAESHRHGPYDVVVACDGAGSRLRAGYPELITRARRYRWTALSCLMRGSAPAPTAATLEQSFLGAHHIASWPVGVTAEGKALFCVSVNIPRQSATQFSHPGSGMAELERLGFARAAALAGLHPITSWIALSASDVVLRRYFHQRLVFLGDAAHSLSPVLGQGTRLALAGAASLAAALDQHNVADALATYDRCQRQLATRYQDWSRWLTPLVHSPDLTTRWLRDHCFPSLARIGPFERSLSRRFCAPLQTG